MSFNSQAQRLSRFEPEPSVKEQRFILDTGLKHSRAIFSLLSLVGLAYYAASWLGFVLTPRAHAIATYWPANAVVMAVLLLVPLRLWPPVLISVLCAHLLVQIPRGIPVSTALGWFVSNSSEALIGAALLRRYQKGETLFDSVRGNLHFLFFGVFVAPFATSFFDAAVVVFTRWDADYWLIWTTRLFSNLLAALTIVPLVIALGSRGAKWMRDATLVRKCELLTLAVSIITVTIFVYGAEDLSASLVPALVYVPLPFLLWACLRFGVGVLASCGTAIAVISFHFALDGRGPFVAHSMVENVLFLQILLLMVIVPLMLLSAVLTERRHTQEELQRSRARLIESQELERNRIARELHDDIVQQLSLVAIELHQMRGISAESLPPAIASSIRNLTLRVDSISESTRALSHGLHPVHLDVLGLASALRSFCSELQRQIPIKIRLRERDLPRQLNRDVSLAIFRVAQEALHNVLKHSHASNVDVLVGCEKGQVVLRITDDGIGFPSDRKHAYGLGVANMNERLAAIDGTLVITGRRLGRGTVVEARVPVGAARKHGLGNSQTTDTGRLTA